MRKFLAVGALMAVISACGGGGDSAGGNGATTAPVVVPPVDPVLATVNVQQAMAGFLLTDRTSSGLASNDGYLGTATLIVRADESYPLVLDGKQVATASTRVIQLQESGADGRLARQFFWKIHLDASNVPTGIAVGDSAGVYSTCFGATQASNLPGAASGSGSYFTGTRGTYAETSRNGSYAHYCDIGAGSAARIEWTVLQGNPQPYLCVTLPDSAGSPFARVCTATDAAGSLFIRKLASDGGSVVDYRSATGNRPVFPNPGAVNPRDYWYGKVWRPRDGYTYQAYEQTRFATEQACRDQSVIDWRATYTATNIGWTCVHVVSS